MRRRTALTVLVAAGVVLLLGSYVVYSRSVLAGLHAEAVRSGRLTARVFAGQTDASEDGAALAIHDLVTMIRVEGEVPLVVTDARGNATATANLPGDVAQSDSAVRAYIAKLDRENQPVVDSASGTAVHYGSTRLVRRLSIIPLVQTAALSLLVVAGIALLLTHGRAEREHMWAGMARESAHQIGTPLSSLHGWIEVLMERAGDPLVDSAIGHMQGDIERLERVSHRFERIGRPPKLEPVDVRASVERVVEYFRARVPTLATPVQLLVDIHDDGLAVPADRVLLEWVLETLIKNAIDALSGTGGTITVTAEAAAGSSVRIRVADNGPGVPAALRKRIFDAGFTTKERGWGIGLALTRRIVEENHGGKLLLVPTPKGAAFDVILPT